MDSKLNKRFGRVINELNTKDIRELIYGNYRIVYKVNSQEIQNLAIIHGARKISKGKKHLWIVE